MFSTAIQFKMIRTGGRVPIGASIHQSDVIGLIRLWTEQSGGRTHLPLNFQNEVAAEKSRENGNSSSTNERKCDGRDKLLVKSVN